MKNNYYVLFVFLLIFNVIQAQENNKEIKEKKSKFEIIGTSGIGFAILKSNNEPTYNLNSNSGEILFNYKFSKRDGIAIGIAHNQLTGNGFNSVGNFYHERSFIRIPLLYTMEYKLTNKIRYITNLGVYAQTIIKDKYQFLNNTQTNIYGGWNFGLEANLGFVFEVSKRIDLGINLSGQSDFDKFSTKDNQIISDQQKIKDQYLIGLLVVFKL